MERTHPHCLASPANSPGLHAHFLLAIASVLLSACLQKAPPAGPADDSLISQLPCAPPCWQGLTPGVSDLQAARLLMQTSPLINGNIGDYFADQSMPGAVQFWWWAGAERADESANWFDFDAAGILTTVTVGFNTKITGAQLVSRYGVPTTVVASLEHPYDIFDSGPTGVIVTVLYQAQAIKVSWFEPLDLHGDVVRFCPQADTPLLQVSYHTQDAIDAYIQNWYYRARDGSIYAPGGSLVEVGAGDFELKCVEIPR